MWNVDFTYIEDWLDEQDDETVASIFVALRMLEVEGPNLKRPLVATLTNTKLKNLKELRPASPKRTEIRILFAFDPRRRAIMLYAGDKAPGRTSRRSWNRWYKIAIPKAEELYEAHIRDLQA